MSFPAASADLPQSSNAGPRFHVVADVVAIARTSLSTRSGPRAHETHFAAQYVDELREFVETGLPQNASDWRDPRIVTKFLQVVSGPFPPAGSRIGTQQTLEDSIREFVTIVRNFRHWNRRPPVPIRLWVKIAGPPSPRISRPMATNTGRKKTSRTAAAA